MLTTSQQRRAWGYILPGLLWTVAFFLLPLLIMGVYSVWRQLPTGEVVRQFTLENYASFFERSVFRQALRNSLEVSLLVTALSVLLAYPLAYILAYQTPPRWQRLALILAVLPFWTSYVVRSYSWLLVLTEQGVISKSLQALGILAEPMSFANNRTGTVIGFVHFFVMLLTLTIFANLVQISPNYRNAAADLGASAWQTFLRITLPLSLPGVLVGAFLTFVLCIGDYITPQILGGNNELLLPQAILLQINRRVNYPMASMLSMVLMVVITLVFLISARRLRIERV